MKKTLALLCALVMALSVLPAISFAANDRDNVAMTDHDPVNFYVTDLDWIGVQPGGSLTNAQKFFYIGLSEYSGMFAAGWLIAYPDAYMSVTNQSASWSGGIIAQIAQSWDDEEAWSDKFASVANVTYVGQSGGSPKGVEGVMYINGGNYLNSGSYMGVQMGGNFHRFTVAYNAQPAKEECLYEAGVGYYLPLDLIMYEFEFMVWDNGPKSSDNAVLDPTPWIEENYEPWFSGTDGKILIYEDDGGPVVEPTDPPVVMVTENFYVDGELWQTVEHEEGADWDMPVYTPAEGYTFSGFEEVEPHEWYGTTELIPPTIITEYFYLDGELYTTVEHEEGAEWAMPEYTPAEGYEFSGWVLGDDGYYYGTTSVIELTLTIYYQYQDGTPIDTAVYTMPYGTEYSYPTPAIEGYVALPEVVEGTLTENYEIHVVYYEIVYGTVTINFIDAVYYAEGTIVKVYESIVVTQPVGSEYTFTFPVVDGYTYEHQGEEETINVTGTYNLFYEYSPNLYPLTIIYQYEDGTEAHEAYTDEILYLRPYSVESPVIEGYTADKPVVNGEMVIDGAVIYVTYTANEHNIVIHYVDGEGNELYPDYTGTAAYGDEYAITSPTDIPNYYPDIEVVEGTMGDADVEVTVVYDYVAPYEPVPPTVEASKAEIRARATEDALKDIRFIFTVNFNDSYVTYKTNNYGPTELYYKILEFWSVLSLENGKSTTVKGTNIYAMYEDVEGEDDMNKFLYTAVLKGVKEANWDMMITATPYLTYTMGGVNTTVDGPAIEASVNSASN